MKIRKSLLISFTLIACLYAGAPGCAMSLQSIEAKNQQLADAERRLLRNPRDAQALSVILRMLSDPDTVARANAASTLGDLGESVGASIGGEAVPRLTEALEKDNVFVKKSAACALEKFGPSAKDAIPVLRKNLRPIESDVAWCAAKALGAMGELAREAVPDLLAVVKDDQGSYSDESTSITEFAVKALGGIGPAAKEAVPYLESLTDRQSPYLRINVSVALIRIDPNNQKALGVLDRLLKSQSVEVRRKTIWSLKDIGVEAKPAHNLLKSATHDSDSDVSVAAAQLLELIDDH